LTELVLPSSEFAGSLSQGEAEAAAEEEAKRDPLIIIADDISSNDSFTVEIEAKVLFGALATDMRSMKK
jgi:hypothetical protein